MRHLSDWNKPSRLASILLTLPMLLACSALMHDAEIVKSDGGEDTDTSTSWWTGTGTDTDIDTEPPDDGTDTGTGTGANMIISNTLTKVLDGAPWQTGQSAPGMTADDSGRIYVVDSSYEGKVYVVDKETVDTYMTLEDVSSITGTTLEMQHVFHDIDVGPDGDIYILTSVAIIKSSAPHEGIVHRDISESTGPMEPEFLGVVSAEQIGMVNDRGFLSIDDSGIKLLYEDAYFGTDCAVEDLAIQRSGVFLYQPGCNAYPIIRGDISGNDYDILFKNFIHTEYKYQWGNFKCSARDPSGGFHVMAEDGEHETNLFKFEENVTEESGIRKILTTPSFGEAADSEADTALLFNYCAIAVAPSGSIYIQSFDQLWRVDIQTE